MGATPPYHRGGMGWGAASSHHKAEKGAKTQGRQSIAQSIRVSPVPCEMSTVKTRRYKQDAKGADSAQRVYLIVPTKPKRKPAVSRDE